MKHYRKDWMGVTSEVYQGYEHNMETGIENIIRRIVRDEMKRFAENNLRHMPTANDDLREMKNDIADEMITYAESRD